MEKIFKHKRREINKRYTTKEIISHFVKIINLLRIAV